MRRLLAGMLAGGLVLLAGCADSPTTVSADASLDDGDRGAAASVNSRPAPPLTGNLSVSTSARVQGTSHGFQTPLFGLATAPNGDVLVADAGSGVSTLSGATEIPLPGVTDASPLGRGSMWVLEGLTGDPGDDTGQGLYRASRGQMKQVADLFAFEEEHNPDGADLIDSNPFDVHALGGDAALVADAGGNDLLRVDNQGHIDLLAVLPDEPVPTANIKAFFGCPEGPPGICGLPGQIPAQPVATSIAVGPDGYYYVGELKGFPAPTGESNIWRIAPDASEAECPESPECVKAFDGGFTSIIDLRFGPDGMLYVVEIDEASWFALELDPPRIEGGSINACDVAAGTCTEVATGIPIVTAVTFGKDGSLWATRNALIPDEASVFQVR